MSEDTLDLRWPLPAIKTSTSGRKRCAVVGIGHLQRLLAQSEMPKTRHGHVRFSGRCQMNHSSCTA